MYKLCLVCVPVLALTGSTCNAKDGGTCDSYGPSSNEILAEPALVNVDLLQTSFEFKKVAVLNGSNEAAVGSQLVAEGLQVLGQPARIAPSDITAHSNDCKLRFEGTDMLRASIHRGCSAENCTIDLFNPTVYSSGRSHCPVLVRVVTNVGANCNVLGSMPANGGSRPSTGDKSKCIAALAEKDPAGSGYYDGLVGGWLNPKTCTIELNVSSYQDGLFDPRLFDTEAADVFYRQVNMLSRPDRHFGSLQTNINWHISENKQKALMTHIGVEGGSSILLFHDGARTCWNSCSEEVPKQNLERMCSEGHPSAMQLPPVTPGLSLLQGKPGSDHGHSVLLAQEKNWSPFSHNGKLMFIYTLDPLRVCEAGVVASLDGTLPLCTLCRSVQERAAQDLFAPGALRKEFARPSVSNMSFHLNGVSLLKLPAASRLQGYLGVGHMLVSQMLANNGERHGYGATYDHFLFVLSPEPPFQVLKVSKPLLLEVANSTNRYHITAKESVLCSFVSGFQFEADGSRELLPGFLVTYGKGDDQSRLLKLSFQDVMRLFDGLD